MITIQKKINLYKYDELNENSKEKVKDDYIESMIECKIDEFSWFLEEELKNYGLTKLTSTFSLAYCQGDGVFLDGYFYLDEIKKGFKDTVFKNISIDGTKKLEEYTGRIEIKNSSVSCIYLSHGAPEEKEFDEALEKLEININTAFDNWCYKMEQDGYLFFYDVTDSEISDYYTDDYFYIDGSFYGVVDKDGAA